MHWKRMGALSVSTLAVALPAFAQGITVSVNGQPLNFGSVPPVSQDGRVLVPLRGVFESLGAIVDYNAATHTIDALRGETRLQLTLGSRTAVVNGNAVTLDVPAQTSLGRTLVPLRFVGEAFGAQVNWNSSLRAISIVSTSAEAPLPTPTPTTTPTPEPSTTTPEINLVSGTFVKVDTSAPVTITIQSNGRNSFYELARGAVIERRPLLSDSTPDNPHYGTTTRLDLDAIQSGEKVELQLDDANRVRRLSVLPQVFVAKVRSASGGRIVLEDARGTTINIGNQLRFINAQGRDATTTNLRAGDEIVLFVSPATRQIYKVSNFADDLNAAYGRSVEAPYLPPGDNGNTNDNGNNATAPEITEVSTNARNALRAGASIIVTVRGTSGLRGSFDLSNRAVNIPLQERTNQPGVYTGRYTILQDDDVYQGRVTAHLVGRDGREVTQQSLDDLTIDTVPPRINDTSPRNGDKIDVAQPNITIDADDLGGSGLAPSTITLTNNGQRIDVPATVTRRGLRAVAPRALSGRVDVEAEVLDEAGNATVKSFSFTVGEDTALGAIHSINHNVTRTLQAGDVVTVEMKADDGGRASFDLLDDANRVVAQGIPLSEITPGRYRGTYTINGTRDAGVLHIVGRFRDANGQLTTRDATTTFEVAGTADLKAPTITSPQDGDRVGEDVTVRGRGTPQATVEISVRVEGVQYLVLPYSRELGASQVSVDRNGNWQTQPITLPTPRNISSLKYIITATQTDNANRTSQETTITVRPR
jgi:hypothetical protein